VQAKDKASLGSVEATRNEMAERQAALENTLRERGQAHAAEVASLRSDNEALRSNADELRKEIETLRDAAADATAALSAREAEVDELKTSLLQAQEDKVRTTPS
jgi:chromosome segregation ATPase